MREKTRAAKLLVQFRLWSLVTTLLPVLRYMSVPLPEKTMLRRIREQARPSGDRSGAGRRLRTGIGDDCAVIQPAGGDEVVVTTDLNIEGTHFRRAWHPPGSIGHRTLARGLSDIAAMGAQPLACFLSLGLPGNIKQSWVDEFLSGFLELGQRFQCPLAGGDLADSGGKIVADIMVLGSVAKGKAILRAGARSGDIIYVTGALGGSAATLRELFAGGVKKLPPQRDHRRHFFPQPRVQVGGILRQKKLPTAMIDISDGLSTDLGHICEESGVGAMLNQHLLPIASGASLEDALHGGEDYELLFTAPKSARVPVQIAGVPVTEIGWITRERGIRITDLKGKPKRLAVRGWEHFVQK